ncbi:hypothetical protein [Flavihumibacter sp. CACIAM 22H1]|uniref:hypothetical protein n=1 Tax=Flavihumibacter sp. CACIAM 22H1 TaxID=1812911 RepID=UPI0007A822C9|nr:hypothetical protein [Flavihumibacter sp. CACIAM 22H1]KYP13103.1 MAG: hypothetical protein A1D16_11885 [Flavihumibacter sp. CACIAM 22H1]
MKTTQNDAVLAALQNCKLGVLKEATANSSDQILRAIIQQHTLQGTQTLQGWVEDDLFIYKNEQRPLEVFAHFLHPSSGLLILINGYSTILQRTNSKGAAINIDIHTLNFLQR